MTTVPRSPPRMTSPIAAPAGAKTNRTMLRPPRSRSRWRAATQPMYRARASLMNSEGWAWPTTGRRTQLQLPPAQVAREGTRTRLWSTAASRSAGTARRWSQTRSMREVATIAASPTPAMTR